MMLTSGVAKKFWPEAFLAAVQVHNLSPLGGIETPHELFFGAKPDVRSLRMFGCEVYCHKTPLALTKLGERSERSLLLCCEQGTKGWRVLLESGDVVIRRNCLFVKHAVEDDDDSDSDMENDGAGDTGVSAMSAAGESDGGDDAAAADDADDSDKGEAPDELCRQVAVPNSVCCRRGSVSRARSCAMSTR
jgi:hypothetical protein